MRAEIPRWRAWRAMFSSAGLVPQCSVMVVILASSVGALCYVAGVGWKRERAVAPGTDMAGEEVGHGVGGARAFAFGTLCRLHGRLCCRIVRVLKYR